MSLGEYGEYGFSVSYSNFMNQSGSSEGIVKTLSKEAPQINFLSDQTLQYYRWQTIMIEAVVRHFRCDAGMIEEVFDALKLNWTEVNDKRNPT